MLKALFFDNGAKSVQAHPIPNLDLLNDLTYKFRNLSYQNIDIENTAIIGVQHLLETTATLLKSFLSIGFKAENIYLCGKCYSTSPEVKASVKKLGINLFEDTAPKVAGNYNESTRQDIRLMWQKLSEDAPSKQIKKIIILDDGGRCFELMPPILRFNYQIAGVEQTRAGLYIKELEHLLFPIVEVASSATKKIVEPAFIAESVISKVEEIIPAFNIQKDKMCGIVGCGAIGLAIANYLVSKGYKVLLYDEDQQQLHTLSITNTFKVTSIETLISNSNFIFGCTGKDITRGLDVLSLIKKDTTFISCSSEDKEFRTLLKSINEQKKIEGSVLDNIYHITKNGDTVTIASGGYPINFWGNRPACVPARHIALTQALLFAGVIQATLYANQPRASRDIIYKPEQQMLSAIMQKYIFSVWEKGLSSDEIQRYNINQLSSLFQSLEWVQNHSKGVCTEHELFKHFEIGLSNRAKL